MVQSVRLLQKKDQTLPSDDVFTSTPASMWSLLQWYLIEPVIVSGIPSIQSPGWYLLWVPSWHWNLVSYCTHLLQVDNHCRGNADLLLHKYPFNFYDGSVVGTHMHRLFIWRIDRIVWTVYCSSSVQYHYWHNRAINRERWSKHCRTNISQSPSLSIHKYL